MTVKPVNLAVLVSGSGTTLQNLLDCIANGSLDAHIRVVIGSRANLIGVQRGIDAGIPTAVVERNAFAADVAAFSRTVFQHIEEADVDLVCMAGWLSLVHIPDRWIGRVMNIHPALLPSFGGAGLYGRRVHEAVLAHGAKVSGCTVHFVDNHYDNGPIILQRCCEVREEDDAASLARRVFEQEKVAYPEAITLFAQEQLSIEARRVRVRTSR